MSKLAVIVIRDPSVEQRQAGSFTFHTQKGFLRTSEDESLAIEVSLPRGHAGYPPGTYHIGGESFTRDQYNRPAFGRALSLIPVSAVAAK